VRITRPLAADDGFVRSLGECTPPLIWIVVCNGRKMVCVSLRHRRGHHGNGCQVAKAKLASAMVPMATVAKAMLANHGWLRQFWPKANTQSAKHDDSPRQKDAVSGDCRLTLAD
jgi:hypothetical protein